MSAGPLHSPLAASQLLVPLLRLLLLPLILAPPPGIHAAGVTTAAPDAAALAAFKASVAPSSIPPWSCLASWDFKAADPCGHPRQTHFTCGVICTTDIDPAAPSALSRVAAITLDPAGYSGTLTPLLARLTALTHLDLSGNSFRGRIPGELLALPALRTLTLSSNSFSGPIPEPPEAMSSNLSSSLVSLDLSHNALSGPIPQSLASLSALRTLDLSFNALSGSLPAQLPAGLVELALRGNQLSGPLKRKPFKPLRYLEVVELGGNAFSGNIEGWLLRMPSLQQVDLTNNSLTGIDLAGAAGGKTDPTSDGASASKKNYAGSRLVALDLGFNRIEGNLPIELAAFPSLTSLSMRQNRLKGGIPADYCAAKKGEPFRRIYLDGNFLNGKLPPGFVAGQLDVSGSFGDNCLDECPQSVSLCSPSQKSATVCSQAYGASGGHAR